MRKRWYYGRGVAVFAADNGVVTTANGSAMPWPNSDPLCLQNITDVSIYVTNRNAVVQFCVVST